MTNILVLFFLVKVLLYLGFIVFMVFTFSNSNYELNSIVSAFSIEYLIQQCYVIFISIFAYKVSPIFPSSSLNNVYKNVILAIAII